MGKFSDRVASIHDVSREIVTVPEWGDLRIEVRSLSLAQRNQIALTTRDKKGNTVVNDYYAALVIASCHDPEDGEKAFSASDIRMLQSKNGAATDRIAKVAMALSGLTPEDDDDDEPAEGTLEQALDPVEEAGKDS